MGRRHEVCSLLQKHEVNCAIWFEDVLGHYGVPTVAFDLYLIVPDIEKAAKVLQQQHGWQTAPSHKRDEFGFLEDTPMLRGAPLRYFRLVPPSWDKEKEDRTVLMPAKIWNITDAQLAQTATDPDRFFPALPVLLDSLIDAWLDADEHQRLLGHLGVQIGYIFGHVGQVKDDSFAEQLRPEHRQFHLNWVAGGSGGGTFPFLKHHRLVRERLLKGQSTSDIPPFKPSTPRPPRHTAY